MERLVKKLRVSTTIELISGLHIGGNSASVEIGGIDNEVIKIATKRNQPYIPGSSLKGKMRCLLEQISGSKEVGGNSDVNKLFGFPPKDDKNMGNRYSITRLIVRDSYLTKDSLDLLKECGDNLDMPYTENKYENSIDRVTGKASNPRQTERIPAGVSFDVEFIINIWDGDDETRLLNLLKTGIKALENDYIGGSGSRGYGQVKFGELKIEDITFDSK